MSWGRVLRAGTTAGVAVLSATFALVWWRLGENTVAAAATVVAAVLAAVPVIQWAFRPSAKAAEGRVWTNVSDQLAHVVSRQWEAEANLRQLRDPQPLTVRWSEAAPNLMDHPDNIRATGRRLSLAGGIGQVVQAYEALPRRRLAVIGPPGSGKTGVLLLLTLGLLERRRQDGPVPLLLSLASWEPRGQPFLDWLRRHLAHEYGVLRGAGARALVDDKLILPLLDGLDELPEDARAEALKAINREWAQPPVVVGCRSQQFIQAVREGDVLTGAGVVELEAVRSSDAREYLRRTTPPDRLQRWAPVFTHLQKGANTPVAEALSTPLMVSLARSVYALDRTVDPGELVDGTRFPTCEAIGAHLLDALIPAVFKEAEQQSAPAPRWTADQAHRWLRFVARRLHQRGTYDLAWWQLWEWSGANRLVLGLLNGLLLGLGVGLVLGLVVGRGLVAGLLAGLFGVFVFGLSPPTSRRAPRQVVFRFDQGLRRALMNGLVVGLALALIQVLCVVFLGLLGVPLAGGLWAGLVAALVTGLGIGLGVGLVGGLLRVSDRDPAPDGSLRGDRQAFISSVTTGWLGGGLVFGLLAALVARQLGGFVIGFVPGLGLGLFGVLVFVLRFESASPWPWYQLARARYALAGSLPWRTMAFLAEAHRLGVVRQVGSVYQFSHASLQDRLAGADADVSLTESHRTRPKPPRTGILAGPSATRGRRE